jgi:ADP-heptose:LPS heptosyltransferase
MARPAPVLDPESHPVLVVMIDHHLGNFVVSLATIHRLATYFHHGVDLIVDERYLPLASMMDSANRLRLLPYPAQTTKRRGIIRNLRPLAATLALAPRRYRAVVSLDQSSRSSVLAAATLARRRVGYLGARRGFVLSDRVPPAPDAHAHDHYARMLTVIGDASPPPPARLRSSEADRATIADQLRQSFGDALADAPIVVIHPGAGIAWRCWPTDRFAAVADGLVERHAARICIIGAPHERPLGDAILGAMRHRDAAAFLSVPLRHLVALFDLADVLVSNESGPTHLAAATDLPIVTIFGPTREALWHPVRRRDTVALRGDTCDPGCGKRRCVADRRCLMSLPADRVVAEADAFLRRRHR